MGAAPVSRKSLKIAEPTRNELIRQAMLERSWTHSMCKAPGCHAGFVALDPDDIDPRTDAPRTTLCPACKGKMMVPDQLELFPDYKACDPDE